MDIESPRYPSDCEKAPSSRRPRSRFGRRTAAVLSIIVLWGVGFLTWKIFYDTDLRNGLNALSAAYRKTRPINSRITGLPFAMAENTRGGNNAELGDASRDRAGVLLYLAEQKDPGPDSHHALGRFYLAGHEYEKAIEL